MNLSDASVKMLIGNTPPSRLITSYVPSDATRKSTAIVSNSKANGCKSSVTIALRKIGRSAGVTFPPDPLDANRVPRASVTVRS